MIKCYSRKIIFLCVLAVFEICKSQLFACPLIGGLVDFNCDGKHKIVAVGDSIVKGIGDLENKNNGGYVKRLAKKFKKSEVINLGLPGYSTSRLYERFKSSLAKRNKNKYKKALESVDILIIDAGRNDFFEDAEPGLTVRNIARLVDLFKTELGKDPQVPGPYIIVASLLPTRRGFQRAFLDTTNMLLFESAMVGLPVTLHFEGVKTDLISLDGIHPTSAGYKYMAKLATAVIKGDAQRSSLAERPDNDNDGIYDMFEELRFGTKPGKKDTDGDKLSDGEELFKYFTDPLNPDTDGDGVNDKDEILLGRNPLFAEPLSSDLPPEPEF